MDVGNKFSELRKYAEKFIGDSEMNFQKRDESVNIQYVEEILQELKVHQIELEMQNDELLDSNNKMEESENRYKTMYHWAPIAYITLDRDGVVVSKNLKACEILGSNTYDKVPFIVYMHPENHNEFFSHLTAAYENTAPTASEVKLKTKNGEYIHVRLSSFCIPGNEGNCLTAIIDLDEIKRKEELIIKMAYFDVLTGLPNRKLFIDRVTKAVENYKGFKKKFAVIFVDLDNFKRINDSQGHDVGDLVLQEIGSRMSKLLRKTDTLARMGGDEFTILIENIGEENEVAIISKKILRSVSQPIYINDLIFILSASIGISIYPHDGSNVEEMLKSADTAMYKSKIKGKNMYSFFGNSMKEEIIERVAKECYLRNALINNELFLVYQPQIEVQTGKVRGVEALLRWNSKELGSVPPSEFIPLAEEISIINTIGEWVIERACKQNKEWQDQGLEKVKVSVNVSPAQIQDINFVKNIKKILLKTGLSPEYLELEITENVNMAECGDAILKLEELKQMGIAICLDDFGTGYSSLNYLNMLPIEILKIDKSFINDISNNKNRVCLVNSIISLSHNLGLKVIAEGVESEEQLSILKESSCDIVQGYYHYRPMNEEAVGRILLLSS